MGGKFASFGASSMRICRARVSGSSEDDRVFRWSLVRGKRSVTLVTFWLFGRSIMARQGWASAVMFGLVALETIPIQLTPDVNRPVITINMAACGIMQSPTTSNI